ncbi:MFS family permease [Leifsonia sp. AK011]|uniref:hypothetical protein n=1 Tax=Leifsonia sp. AK011 TaxID=2723075 RepID=UPI0015CCC2E4|nr:hypothetical protein [Leifsonia sp. AK011]NYF09877.1 MFS family permease [Leifsonia sp. AK011]
MSYLYLLDPLVSIIVTALLFGVVVLLTAPIRDGARQRVSETARATWMTTRWFGVGASSAILVTFVAASLPLATGNWQPFVYRWYQHPLPLLVAAVALAAVTVALRIRRRAPEAPTLTADRRTWRSFSTRGDLILVVASATLTALLCGGALALQRWMSIPDPDGKLVDFFGWRYSLPVLVGTLLVVALWALSLHTVAAPAFSRPDAMREESAARRALATSMSRISIAAIALSFGTALASAGAAATGYGQFVFPVIEVAGRLGFGSVGDFLIVLGRWAQILGVVLLLLSLLGGRRVPRFGSRAPGRAPALETR